MKFNENPYYSPHLCGLEIFDSIDTAGSYEFSLFVIWKKLDDNTLWYDSDSGCSCPSPFDEHGHNLKEITIDTYFNFKQALKNHDRITEFEYKNMKTNVWNHIK